MNLTTRRVLVLAVALAWLGPRGVSHAQLAFQDMFANRQTTTNASGQLNGNNSTATVETNEPLILSKPGGHSLWIDWVAPANGVATFQSDGSTFDTLLAAYYFGSTNDTTLDKLHVAAANDDFLGIEPASLIQFGALAGQHYAVKIDGYQGAMGDIRLKWSFLNATSPPPIVISVPSDQAFRLGDPVSLTVDMQTAPGVQLQWRHNETEIEDLGTNLVIASLQPTNVGRYSLRVTVGSVRFFTMPTEIQINSDGQTNALARDKLLDSIDSPLIGSDGGGGLAPVLGKTAIAGKTLLNGSGTFGVVIGYDGSQIFDTTYATTDPNEPAHCGVAGGASYWLIFQPPNNGTITLDTVGSTYDTVMEAYTYNAPPTGYQDLISLACDNDGVAPQGAARIQFPVVKTRQYAIVVDGVNGARGTAELNYQLNTNAPPQPPTLLQPPPAITVAAGSTVLLAPEISGCPPLTFVWRKDGVTMPGWTSPSVLLSRVSPTNSGNYSVFVTNDLGQVGATIPLRVVIPPACSISATITGFQLGFPSVIDQTYTIEEAPGVGGPWSALTNSYAGTGQTITVDLAAGSGSEFYRIRVQ